MFDLSTYRLWWKYLSAGVKKLERFDSFFRSQSLAWLFFGTMVLAIIVGFFDYLTGYEVTLWPFYSIPVVLMLWFGNRSLAIVISVVSTGAWWWADRASGHVYSSEWLRLWDAMVRLMFFCLVIFAGWTFRQQRDAIRARLELLERSQRLEQEITGISEREQQRIGRDLHDGVCQFLVAIGFTASMLNHELERESHVLAKTAGEIARLLQDAAAIWLAASLRSIEMRAVLNRPCRNWRRALPGWRESLVPSSVRGQPSFMTTPGRSIFFASLKKLWVMP